MLRAYLDEVVGRYHGRAATKEELERALREAPSDDLVAPTGVLLVAREDDCVVGCVGVRVIDDDIGEVTRLFVARAARGAGLGERLVRAAEAHARERGLREVRLATRHDLVEARRLYMRLGYAETARFSDEPYVDRWFRKRLD